MKENSLEDWLAHRYRCPAAFQRGVPSRARAPSPEPGLRPEGGCPALGSGSAPPGAPAPSPAPSPPSPRPRRRSRLGAILPGGGQKPARPRRPPSLPSAAAGLRERERPWGRGRAGQDGRCRRLLLAAADSGAGAVPPRRSRGAAAAMRAGSLPTDPAGHAAPAAAGAGRTCGQPWARRGRERRRVGGGPGRGGGVGPAPSQEGARGGSCRQRGEEVPRLHLEEGASGPRCPRCPSARPDPDGAAAPSTLLRRQGFYCRAARRLPGLKTFSKGLKVLSRRAVAGRQLSPLPHSALGTSARKTTTVLLLLCQGA